MKDACADLWERDDLLDELGSEFPSDTEENITLNPFTLSDFVIKSRSDSRTDKKRKFKEVYRNEPTLKNRVVYMYIDDHDELDGWVHVDSNNQGQEDDPAKLHDMSVQNIKSEGTVTAAKSILHVPKEDLQ